jgi:hypothetical protein
MRPGFEQLLTDVASGLIDGICVWDSDGLARQPRDLERLIDLYETRKGLVFATATRTSTSQPPTAASTPVYRGELFRDADGQPVKGPYEAVLDVETRAYEVGTITARKHGIRPGKRKYLLAGIARCAACSGALHRNRGPGVSSISVSSPAVASVLRPEARQGWLRDWCGSFRAGSVRRAGQTS